MNSNKLNVDYLSTDNEYLGKICKAFTDNSQLCSLTDSCTIITLISMLTENLLDTDDSRSVIRMERAYNEDTPLCENILINFSLRKFDSHDRFSKYVKNNGEDLDINNLYDIGVLSKNYSLKYKESFDNEDEFIQNIINDLIGFIVCNKISNKFKTKIIVGSVALEINFECFYDNMVYH
jgi:hypothetical protein